MTIKTLPHRARTGDPGWAHPYPVSLFSPFFYADSDEDEDEDDDPGDKSEGDDDPEDGPGADPDPEDDPDPDPEGADDLGDKGKQALDRMKARLKAERDRRRAAETERDQLKAKPAEDEADPERIRAEAEQAATAKANGRIVRSEVKAAATGKLANPADALVFLDLSQFEVDEDGQVDEDEVAEAIENLLTDRPYLAVAAPAKQSRFQGTGDGGARKGTGGPKQLTEHEVRKLTPEQIDEAHRKGQLRDYLGG